jgi:hypothetical protein
MIIFLQMPFVVSIIIISIVSILIFLAAEKLTRNRIHHDTLVENHAVSGFIYNAVCVIYAVLIAFVVFVIWGNLEKTNSKIEGEANNLLNLYYDASVFPDSIKKNIQSTIREYVYDVTMYEWKEMAKGKADSVAAKQFIKLNRIYLSIKSSDVPNPEVLTQSMEDMKDVREFRRHRLLSSRQSMPDMLWFVLILSTIMIVAFTFLFSVKNILLNNTMISFLIFVSVLVMYLVFVMDHPYVGVDAIKPDAFQPLMDIVYRMGK